MAFQGSGWTNDVIVADFNGDGKLDMGVVWALDGVGNSAYTVYLGDGHGGFAVAPGSPFSVPSDAIRAATGDFNGDGKLDIAICHGGSVRNHPDNLSVYLGDGHGGFAPAPSSPIALPTNPAPFSIQTGDFNGDGKLDLITANFAHTVSLFLGNGNGTFTLAPGSPVSIPTDGLSVELYDVNRDGKLDAVIGSQDAFVSVLLGDGVGHLTLASGSPIPAGRFAGRIALADLNNDGKVDIVVANRDTALTWPPAGAVSVLLGNGDGTFRSSGNPLFYVNGSWVHSVAVADFNQDGKKDILAVTFDGTAYVLGGNGDGTFVPESGNPYPIADLASGVAVGDFDGDGTPDFVVATGTVSLNQSKPPNVAVTQSHAGNFTQGQIGTYTVQVSNQSGGGPTRGSVTVFAPQVPGLTLISMYGVGWNCIGGQCQRSDVRTNGTSYPPIGVTVRADLGAPAQVTNRIETATLGAPYIVSTDVIQINRVTQSVIFLALENRTYGAGPFTLNATASSSLPVVFGSNSPQVCTVSGSTTSIVGAGLCSISALQAGSTIYEPVLVTQSFIVAKASVLINVDPKTITYGTTPAYSFSVTGLVNNDLPAVITGAPTYTTNATTTNGRPNVGNWTVTAAVGTLSANNYTFGFIPGSLAVSKAPLTIRAQDVTRSYGAGLLGYPVTYLGLVNGDTPATATTGATFTSCSANQSSPPGTYEIVTTQGTLVSPNYSLSFASGILTINKGGTTLSLAVSGGTLTATLAVSPPAAGIPTGTVEFRRNGQAFGTAVLTGNTASFPASVGSISAVYSGDTNFNTSVSGVVDVWPAPSSSLSLNSSPNPSTLGQPVTFAAGLETSGGAPTNRSATGTVRFFEGSTLLGTAPLTGGQAVFTISTLTGGTHTITAEYGGDSTWPSASIVRSQSVSAPVTLTTSASPAEPVYGQTISVTASLAGTNVPAGFAKPTGQVSFTLPGATPFSPPLPLGTVPLASGIATLNTSALAAGTYTVTAQYGGDSIWSSASRTITLTVSPASTTSSTAFQLLGGQAILTGNVLTVAPGAGTPTGTVQFLDTLNHTVVASASLSAGKAAVTLTPSDAAALAGRPLAAVYSSDANFKASTSVPLPTIVNAVGKPSASVAADEIASIFGMTGLSGDIPAKGSLTNTLGGVAVNLTDAGGNIRPALLYGTFASAGQINFLVPDAAAGLAGLSITVPGGTISTLVRVANSAPGIFTANAAGDGAFAGQVLYIQPDGTQTFAAATDPIRLSPDGTSVYLILYGTGLRHAGKLTAAINGAAVPVAYFGAHPQYPGVDQINLGPLPQSLVGAGLSTLAITAGDQPANPVNLTIE